MEGVSGGELTYGRIQAKPVLIPVAGIHDRGPSRGGGATSTVMWTAAFFKNLRRRRELAAGFKVFTVGQGRSGQPAGGSAKISQGGIPVPFPGLAATALRA